MRSGRFRARLRYTRCMCRLHLVFALVVAACLFLAGCGSGSHTRAGGITEQQLSCPGDNSELGSYPCTTQMQLVCQRVSGRTVLSKIPGGVNGVESGTTVWFSFLKHGPAAASGGGGGWTTLMPLGGLMSKDGRATYRWPGARRAKALVKVPNGVGKPATEQFLMSVTCSR